MTLSDLPVEILSEIFSRLPVRSLLSCQCVCKLFDTLIRNPTFIDSHVIRNSTSSTNTSCSVYIRVIDENHEDRYEHILVDNKDNYVYSTSHVRQSNPITTHISIIGSCNGLFCADLNTPGEQRGSCIMLWNPVTRGNRYLPKAKINVPDKQIFPVLAFGFVPETNDYKVVRVISYYTSGIHSPLPNDVFVMQIEVYKMSTDSWTVFEAKALPCYGPNRMFLEIDPFLPLDIGRPRRTLFLEGAFHWLAHNPKIFDDPNAAVVAFDLKDEELKLLSVVESHRILHANDGKLEILNDLLGLIVPHDPVHLFPGFDIWVMNDYGNGESWSKQYSIENFTGLAHPWGYWKDNLLLMENSFNRSLFFYDLHTEESTKISEFGYFYYNNFCSYVETLVPVSLKNAIAENADQYAPIIVYDGGEHVAHDVEDHAVDDGGAGSSSQPFPVQTDFDLSAPSSHPSSELGIDSTPLL